MRLNSKCRWSIINVISSRRSWRNKMWNPLFLYAWDLINDVYMSFYSIIIACKRKLIFVLPWRSIARYCEIPTTQFTLWLPNVSNVSKVQVRAFKMLKIRKPSNHFVTVVWSSFYTWDIKYIGCNNKCKMKEIQEYEMTIFLCFGTTFR